MPYNHGYYLGGRYRNGYGRGGMMRPYNSYHNYGRMYGPYSYGGGCISRYNPFNYGDYGYYPYFSLRRDGWRNYDG